MDWLAAGFLLLVLTSAYLAARAGASVFYFGNVVLRLVLGLAVLVAGLRRFRGRFAGQPVLLRAGSTLLAVGGVLGLALMVTGATRPYRGLLHAHVGLMALGAVLVL